MYRRKIQLIAGSTYSVSLPKDWIVKNHLKEKNELIITEKNDQTLLISSKEINEKELKEINLEMEEYAETIDRILFAVYYLGIEKINILSKKEFPKDFRAKVRKTLTHMSGTEISYEDKRKISIRVLLDKYKVDLMQVLYRMSLIIESSINNIIENPKKEEIRINENEVDRLYHLSTQIISSSLIDQNVLRTSGIINISLIPSYFLLAKRLEHLGDEINHLASHLIKKKLKLGAEKEVLKFVHRELYRSMSFLLNKKENFNSVNKKTIESKKSSIDPQQKTIAKHLEEMLRFLLDIEEEIVNIAFYNQLVKKGYL